MEEEDNETYQDTGHSKIAGHSKKRGLRGMPDILSVSM